MSITGLIRRLKGRSVIEVHKTIEEADRHMPWSYQFANPDGRPYHDDWGIVTENKILKVLQPWQKIKRMSTTYMLPLPLKLIKGWGGIEPEWMPWQQEYEGGASPWAQFRPAPDNLDSLAWQLKNRHGKNVQREILAYHPNPKPGQAGLFGVWLDGKTIPCFYTAARKIPFTNKQVQYYYGLKPDMTWGDFGLYMWETSLGIKSL